MRPFAAVAVLTLFVCASAAAQQAQPAITPDTFWTALVRGNEEYVKGKLVYEGLQNERRQFADGQMPPMTVLSCADSRVPPELIFNQSLGALFVVRSAGNVADTFALGSIEYAIEHGWTQLIVVLGHEKCGAVRDSMGTADPSSPNLLALAQRVRSSFVGISYKPDDPAIVRKAVEANARASAAALLAQSAVIRKAVTEGRVKIVTAYYELESGKVTRLE